MRWNRFGYLGMLVLAGCPTGDGEECPDGSLKEVVRAVAEQCDDVFDCPPTVELAFATGADDFAATSEGSEQEVYYGTQGGYHLFVAAEMHNLCPVVFLDFSMDILREDGGRETIQALDRHVQTVRCETQEGLFNVACDDDVTQQRWWGLQLSVPCDYYPNDPEPRELNCEDPPVEHIEDLDLILRVEVRDHSSLVDPSAAREASAEILVDPTCCSS